jgi:hypothetical protein
MCVFLRVIVRAFVCVRRSVCARAHIRVRACVRSCARASVGLPFHRQASSRMCGCVCVCRCARAPRRLCGRCGGTAGTGSINSSAGGAGGRACVGAIGRVSHVLAAGRTFTNRTLAAPWGDRASHTSVFGVISGAIYVIGGNDGQKRYQDVWVSTDGGARAGLRRGSGTTGIHRVNRGTKGF